MDINEIFESLDSRWHCHRVAHGRVKTEPGRLILRQPAHDASQYTNAQLDDYSGLKRADFPWRPPLKMTVRACASHPVGVLQGTAGFGFWNDPAMRRTRELPRIPRAAWFFHASPQSNMALDRDVPGCGWKAATFDAHTLPFYLLLPFAPLGFLFMRIPFIYNLIWPRLGQRALKVSEAQLDVDITAPHTYALIWLEDRVQFLVDDQLVHTSPYSPKGPLGFVAWLDNLYAVVTPQGNLRFGYVDRAEPQHLLLEYIHIEALT